MADPVVRIDVDTDAAVRSLDELADASADTGRTLDKLDADPVDVDTDAAVRALDDVAAAADRVAADPASVRVDVDTTSVRRARQALDDVDDGLDRVRGSADQSRSVVANFAGNAAQEIPAVTGALGPLNMALGQFAEYGAEGNLQLKNLAAAGVALGAASLVLNELAENARKAAEANQWEDDRVDAYADALRDAASATEAIAATLTEVGKIEVRLPFDQVIDVTPGLAKVGLSVDQFAELVAGGTDRIAEWEQAMIDAGIAADSVGFIAYAAAQESERYADAADAAAASAAVFGDDMLGVSDAADGSAQSVNAARRALDRWAVAVGRLDVADAVEDVADAFDAAEDAALDAYTAATEGSADADRAVRDYEQAQRDLTRAVLDYDQNVRDLPDDVVTDIAADIAAGRLDEARRKLDALTTNDGRGWQAPITPTVSLKDAATALSALTVPRTATVNVVVNPPAGYDARALADAINGGVRVGVFPWEG